MKADVLALVNDLSGGLADPVMTEAYYREVVIDLGQRENLLVQVSLIDHGIDLGNYDSPDATLKLLSVFYDDTELGKESQGTIESVDRFWRERNGRPQAFITDTEGDQRFRVWPMPDVPSHLFAFPTGSVFGADYPAEALGVIHTENRRDVPSWIELPVALLVLAREMARESDHTDLGFAKLCQDAGMKLLDLVDG